MSNVSKRRRDGTRAKIKSMGEHTEFLKRITKTLYYGQLPSLACLSLPVTEISCELWSVSQRGRSLRRLHADTAARMARQACVSPCALVLAILYLERLKTCNPDYLASTSPSDLFLVSLMVSNKFLQDDGEEDEVVVAEWAASGRLDAARLKRLEIEFLNAIEWNVFVSERAFEQGLAWLERQVALRQARLRGFFTYGDLAASCHGRLLLEATMTALASLAGAVAVVAGSILVSQAWLPTMQQALIARNALVTLLAPMSSLNPLDIPLLSETVYNNATLQDETLEEPRTLTCCAAWLRRGEAAGGRGGRRWYDGLVGAAVERQVKGEAPRRAWLYQASLVDPAQRWLEKLARLLSDSLDQSGGRAQCGRSGPGREKLNYSRVGAQLGSFSDR